MKKYESKVYKDIMLSEPVYDAQLAELRESLKSLHAVEKLMVERMMTYYDFDRVGYVTETSAKTAKMFYNRAIRKLRVPNTAYKIAGGGYDLRVPFGKERLDSKKLSTKVVRALKRSGFNTVEELMAYGKYNSAKLTYIPGIGKAALSELLSLQLRERANCSCRAKMSYPDSWVLPIY